MPFAVCACQSGLHLATLDVSCRKYLLHLHGQAAADNESQPPGNWRETGVRSRVHIQARIKWIYRLLLELAPAFYVQAVSATTKIGEIQRVPPPNLTEI